MVLKLRIFSDGFGALEENLFTNVYFNDEEIRSARTIVDLGAHQCSFTIGSIIKASPGSTIIAVEPNPIATKLCLDNIKALSNIVKAKSLRIKVLNAAVWDSRGEVYLDMSCWSEGAHVSTVGGGLKVGTVTMDDILNLAEGRTIVKMDIEGAEYRCLQKADLGNIDIISMEIHGPIEPVRRILESKGFKVMVYTYPINKDLAHLWLRIKPTSYGIAIAMYRLIASQIAKPTITIVKGYKE